MASSMKTDPFNTGADVHFVGDDSEWRDDESLRDEIDPDDELTETTQDVIAILGFDPLESDAEQFAEPKNSDDPDANSIIDFAGEKYASQVRALTKRIEAIVKKNG